MNVKSALEIIYILPVHDCVQTASDTSCTCTTRKTVKITVHDIALFAIVHQEEEEDYNTMWCSLDCGIVDARTKYQYCLRETCEE